MSEKEILNEDTLHDFVVAHGFGAPTPKGWEMGRKLWEHPDYNGNYSDLAWAIVSSAECMDFEDGE